jgi:pilus assembly protein Flp/PilA
MDIPSAIGWTHNLSTENKMKNSFLMLSVKLQNMLSREEGQDLVEYGLLVSLIALAAIVGMKALATDINLAFTNLGTALTSA